MAPPPRLLTPLSLSLVLLAPLLLVPPPAANAALLPAAALGTVPSSGQATVQQQPLPQPHQHQQGSQGSFWFRTLRSAGGLRRLLMPPVPPQCAYTGFNMQMQCNGDLMNFTSELVGKPTNDLASLAPTLPLERLADYLDKRTTPPSAQCCEAAGAFINLYCLCAPAMRDEFEEFVQWDQLRTVASYLSKNCGQVNRPIPVVYMDDNCPEHPI
ncbi:hypothetical protein CHLRE_02g119300v5 [Chlamydomonas reinhardtii]|uniref:Bifunctional inhibitor/plant lipid transfer protein/seed storage helical domain-containing protein n=1 Tax=Chlamydomonas reinhardtii TaxID=3055 RepID=A0A2K3E3J5_CHLRE|nr:uncharacterized protein CHLRE_02g119300v5 [Chlamydomonas reinhardtii]PNW87352.1 hypothetical protein CHLRE_02g119300v5 [Chlamydomonas reinhardtii]